EPNGEIVVKVVDFGIAKLTSLESQAGDTGGLTSTGSMLGTPYYMSPEQAFAERDIDHRADIWSLGVILYECLSGVRPTQAENVGQILKIVMKGQIPALKTLVPDVPDELDALVSRMLSREREDRPKDLREVLELLASYSNAEAPTFGPPSTLGAVEPAADDAR